ncbi:MAG TPA: hypothetical protein VFP86_15960, partial [bacterium]|nr:hypothetical protein [bacterium]
MDASTMQSLRSPRYLATCALAFFISTFVTSLVLIHTREHPRPAMIPQGAAARLSDRRAEPTGPAAAAHE